METVLKAIGDWLKSLLTAGIMSNLSGLFDAVNEQVGDIAQQVGTRPSAFEPRVFAMIESLSRNVVLPIAGIILTFIACYELIEIITQHNNINPIIVWNGLIIDGHNRYAILQKHPDIPYAVHEKEFADRYEAIVWICKNQLGRRNLTVEQKNYLIGKQYEAEKQSDFNRGNQYTSSKKSGCYQNGNSQKASRTCERIASENGIARNTVIRAEKFAKGVDAAEEAVPGTRQKVLSGEVKPTAAEIASVARAPPEDRPALVEKICAPKETKKSSSKSTSKSKKVEKSTTSTAPCEVQAEPAVIEVPPEPIIQSKQRQPALQTIRTLSTKMESVEQVADAEGMLSEVSSAADSMIYRLDVCFEHYPEFLKNPKIRQKVVGLLQKAKDYIVKLEGEFAYD